MHTWGDKWPHWSDLYKAEEHLGRELRRYRLPVSQLKEKYGTICCYMGGLGWCNVHDILWPGHVFCRWPCTCDKQRKLRSHQKKWNRTPEWKEEHKDLQAARHKPWCVQGFLWHLDIYVWPTVFKWLGITAVTRMVHAVAYVRAYESTVKAFPHIAREILSDADHGRLLSHMWDWNKWWTCSSGYRYPQPNPAWVSYIAQHKPKE